MDTTLQLDDGRTVKLRVRSPESYTPNLLNTNQGQERGKAALDDSLQKSGFHRGIVVAKDDQVVNGNHAYQSASELGVVKSWIEIEVEGDVGVVTKRLDWETAQDPKAIVAAIADNRVSELNFSIDTEAFQQALDVLAEAGLELPDTLYTEAELNETIAALGGDGDGEEIDAEDVWKGMPGFEQEDKKAPYSIKVNFYSIEDINDFSAKIGQKVTDKTTWINYPFRDRDDMSLYSCE